MFNYEMDGTLWEYVLGFGMIALIVLFVIFAPGWALAALGWVVASIVWVGVGCLVFGLGAAFVYWITS